MTTCDIMFFPLTTTWKGKPTNQIEYNSQMRTTFFWIHGQSYHSPLYQILNLTAMVHVVWYHRGLISIFVLYFMYVQDI